MAVIEAKRFAPIDRQRQFAKHAEQICSIQAQQRIATQKAVATFHALITQVFENKEFENSEGTSQIERQFPL